MASSSTGRPARRPTGAAAEAAAVQLAAYRLAWARLRGIADADLAPGPGRVPLRAQQRDGRAGRAARRRRPAPTGGRRMTALQRDARPVRGVARRGARRAGTGPAAASAAGTRSATYSPISGANLAPWPEHGEQTTSGPTRSSRKSSRRRAACTGRSSRCAASGRARAASAGRSRRPARGPRRTTRPSRSAAVVTGAGVVQADLAVVARPAVATAGQVVDRSPSPGPSWITLGHGGADGSSRGKWNTCCLRHASAAAASTSPSSSGAAQPPAATTAHPAGQLGAVRAAHLDPVADRLHRGHRGRAPGPSRPRRGPGRAMARTAASASSMPACGW